MNGTNFYGRNKFALLWEWETETMVEGLEQFTWTRKDKEMDDGKAWIGRIGLKMEKVAVRAKDGVRM